MSSSDACHAPNIFFFIALYSRKLVDGIRTICWLTLYFCKSVPHLIQIAQYKDGGAVVVDAAAAAASTTSTKSIFFPFSNIYLRYIFTSTILNQKWIGICCLHICVVYEKSNGIVYRRARVQCTVYGIRAFMRHRHYILHRRPGSSPLSRKRSPRVFLLFCYSCDNELFFPLPLYTESDI